MYKAIQITQIYAINFCDLYGIVTSMAICDELG